MIRTFLSHQQKNFWRSRNKGGNIAAQVLMGFFMLYFLAIALSIGFGMIVFLKQIFPQQDIFKSFNGLILYYFSLDFLLRWQLQELPTLSIKPYLHLKISKSKIISFLNVKALFSLFNLWPILLFFPFILVKIMPNYGALQALSYVVTVLSIALFNNYFILYLKRKSITNIWYTVFGLAIIATFAALEYFKIISLTAASNFIFGALSHYPFISLAFAVAAFAIFKFNANFLLNNLYVEELSSKQEKKVSTDYAFLNYFGASGELAALELKLILRNKRSKMSFFMSFLFVFYGFLLYKPQFIQSNSFGMMIFAAVFMTGFFMITYGQFMFAWQSAHFDGLLANKVNHKDFIKAKFLLFTLSSTILFILSSFYGFISIKLLLLQLVAYLYNVGLGSVMVLFFATLNKKRLDISKSASFNWQGVGATQWIMGFPLLLVPIFIYLPFSLLKMPYWGIFAIGILGLTAVLMRSFWVDFIVKKFEKQRYKIAEGFRE